MERLSMRRGRGSRDWKGRSKTGRVKCGGRRRAATLREQPLGVDLRAVPSVGSKTGFGNGERRNHRSTGENRTTDGRGFTRMKMDGLDAGVDPCSLVDL